MAADLDQASWDWYVGTGHHNFLTSGAVHDLTRGFKRQNFWLIETQPGHWSIEFQPHHSDFDYVNHFIHYYSPLAANNVNVDIISADEALDGYQLVIAPALLILNDQRVANLTRFVERGGYLILTIRTGMKDEFNAFLPARQPGSLATLSGVEVEEYYALVEPVSVQGKLLEGVSNIWAERLRILDPERVIPVAHYGKSNGWLDDQVAIAVHPYGKGMVYYVGAFLDEVAQQVFTDHVLKIAGIHFLKSPRGVEIRTRLSPTGEEIFFLINHTNSEKSINLLWPAWDHLKNRPIQDGSLLGAYETMILTKDRTG